MNSKRDRILDAAEDLLIARGGVPSLDAVAREAGVSKGGLLYHFDRNSLLSGIVVRAVQRVDAALAEARVRGRVAATWLRLSMPGYRDLELYRALLSLGRVAAQMAPQQLARSPELVEAEVRWESWLVEELGDPTLALLVRCAGDGLLWAGLLGQPVPPGEVEALIVHLGLAG